MTYLYCITAPSAPGPPPATLGLDGAPVRRVGDAWVSDVPARSVRATLERIRAHDTVVAAALATGSTPLPARFGQTFADDNECVDMLSARAAQLSASLARVAGMVEMTVLLGSASPAPLATMSGTAYLRSVADREHATDTLRRAARDVNARMAPYVRESAERAAEGVVTLSHLVEREALPKYTERIQTLIGGMDARIVGPVAPYSFGQPE
jgi:hypothetical protein